MLTKTRPPAAKIVFVNRYFAPDESATSRMLSDLAFGLASQGLSVEVVTSRQLYEDRSASLQPREVIKGVTVRRVLTSTRGRGQIAGRALDYGTFHFSAGVELLRCLRPGDVVVAKTDPPLISVGAARAAALRRAVMINWLQDLFPEVATALTPDAMPAWVQGSLMAARDRSLRTAAMNIVLSEAMRERIVQRGVDSERIRIIPNWANVTEIAPLPTAASLTRARAGLRGCFVVGYSGNLGRVHDFSTVIDAARRLRADPDIAFLITGTGAKAAALRRSVESEGFTNFVFQDYQPPAMLSDSLAASDIHMVSLLPSMEGLIVPSKIYGILAAGRPALFIGDVRGTVGRLVREHDCGIAVPIGAGEQLANELRALKDAPERITAMGRRARELALSRHTSAHALADWIALLDDAAPQLRRPILGKSQAPVLTFGPRSHAGKRRRSG